MLKYLD